MKDWHISIGGKDEIEGQSVATNIGCFEMPWYVYLIEHAFVDLCCFPIFYWRGKKKTLHNIKLPSWPTWYSKWAEGKTNPKDYWGDLGAWYCCIVTGPIYTWAYKRYTSNWSVQVPWALLKPLQSAETIKWVEENMKMHSDWKEERGNLTSTPTSDPVTGSNTNQS